MDALKKFDAFVSTKDTTKHDKDHVRSNRDLDPTGPSERTWKVYNYVAIWFQSTFNVNEWNTGATLLKSTGLPYGQVIGGSIIGIFMTCFFTVINARGGSDYHLGYPVLARSVFGVRAAPFFVFVRMFVAAIWFGVQTYYGAMCFDVAMRCMFGYKWYDLHNALPESSKTSTRIVLAFFIYWLIQFPLMWCHPKHIRYFFTAKAFIMPIATGGLFIFCMIRGKGVGNWSVGEITGYEASNGNKWMNIINTVFGTLSPMIINQPDVARYAKRKQDTVIPQAIGFIPPKICVFIFGMASACAINRAYGTVYWNMWDLLNAILDNEWGAGARTGIWFVSVAFAIGTAGTNIFANSIPFAADLCGILPKYFTIIRAQIFVGLLAWATVPWRFLSDAAEFITFLGSYSIFVAPLLGCILADFYVIRRGNIHVPSLYTYKDTGAYHYWKGVNVWGVAVWVLSPILGIPGLYRAYYPESLSPTATNIYNCGWLYTFLTAFFLYTACGLYFKPKIYPDSHADTPKTWEYMVDTDGFFEDDAPIGEVGYPGTVEIYEASESDENSSEKLKVITSIKSSGGLHM